MTTQAALKVDRLRQFREASRRWYSEPANKQKKAEYDRSRQNRSRPGRVRVRAKLSPVSPKKPKQTDEERLQKAREYRAAWLARPGNRERVYAQQKAWKDKPENRGYDVQNQRRRRLSDPGYRMACNLRRSLRDHVRSAAISAAGSSRELIGCTFRELRGHLESQFLPGMNWSNYGGSCGWHVDHAVPCASFDLSDPAQQRACFHWSNLQPLWASENLSKQDLLPDGSRGRSKRKPFLSQQSLVESC